MSILGAQAAVDFGSGPRKLFRVRPGETAPISIDVSDGRDRYAIGIMYPFPAGAGDTNRHLAYRSDPTWRDLATFYATRTTNVNQQWSYNLEVLTNTPPDFYLLTIQTAGITNSAAGPTGAWNHLEEIYVQVAPTEASAIQIKNGELKGTSFSVRLPTTPGLAYTLEYTRAPSESSWTAASQIPGDGGTRVLTDNDARDRSRFYRVRVE